jgi:Flp pilus assembly protein TadG
MMTPPRLKKLRRGAILLLVAILLVPFLAMVAFSVDIGWGVEARAELVNVTDAAALAGAQQLYANYSQWQTASSSNQSTVLANATVLARATATAVANSNSVGGVSLQLVSTDIDVGYTDSNGTYYSGNQNRIPSGSFPNTVKVIGRRDNTSLPNSNGELPLFFGKVLGKGSVPLTASATAVCYSGMITGFKSLSGVNGTLLPIAVDMTQWTSFYNQGASSPYADPNAPSGSAWLQIYPGGTGASMDGLLSLDGAKAASQTYYSGSSGWIQAGPTSSDISGLYNAGDLPLPTNGSGETWASGPGMKSSLLGDFQSLITTPPKTYLLPLFDPSSSGTTGGGNGTYQICYFVPVQVVYAQGHGKANMDIAVVPAAGQAVTDPTAIVGNLMPMGSSSSAAQYMVPVPPKLTQ